MALFEGDNNNDFGPKSQEKLFKRGFIDWPDQSHSMGNSTEIGELEMRGPGHWQSPGEISGFFF